jgi:hypothetical protein
MEYGFYLRQVLCPLLDRREMDCLVMYNQGSLRRIQVCPSHRGTKSLRPPLVSVAQGAGLEFSSCLALQRTSSFV